MERLKWNERSAFERFCRDARLTIVDGTLTQPTPPAPDILVDLRGVGKVAFELVRIDDAAYIQRSNAMSASRDLLRQFHASLDEGSRASFDALYGDAFITVEFDGQRSIQDRRSALEPLFHALMKVPSGIAGPVLEEPRARPKQIARVYVGRSDGFAGPVFDSPSSGRVLPLNLDKLREKLAKRYKCEAPIELLAYAREVAHLSDEKEIVDLVREALPKSAYRRVWMHEDLLHQLTPYERS